MARIKTLIQKELNQKLKDMNSDFKAYTEADFRNKQEARDLLALYTATKNFGFPKGLPLMRMMEKIAKPQDIIIEGEIYAEDFLVSGVTDIFKLSDKSLAKKIKSPLYIEALEDRAKDRENDILDKVQFFIEFCKLIDNLQKEVTSNSKEQLTNALNVLNSIECLRTQDIEYSLYFLQNYKLNQITKVKADYLLLLDLPNINTDKIAKKVVNLSSINKR